MDRGQWFSSRFENSIFKIQIFNFPPGITHSHLQLWSKFRQFCIFKIFVSSMGCFALLLTGLLEIEEKPLVFSLPMLAMTSGLATLEGTCESSSSRSSSAWVFRNCVNFRYSRNHTHLNPNEEPFWRFSWDQMGRFDLPAMLDRVGIPTKKDICDFPTFSGFGG